MKFKSEFSQHLAKFSLSSMILIQLCIIIPDAHAFSRKKSLSEPHHSTIELQTLKPSSTRYDILLANKTDLNLGIRFYSSSGKKSYDSKFPTLSPLRKITPKPLNSNYFNEILIYLPNNLPIFQHQFKNLETNDVRNFFTFDYGKNKYYFRYITHKVNSKQNNLLIEIEKKGIDKPIISSKKGANQLVVASWNVLALQVPGFPKRRAGTNTSDMLSRVRQVPRHLKPSDIVIFQEAFEKNARQVLMDELDKNQFSYTTSVVGEKQSKHIPFVKNGGVFIASKHPIVEEDEFIYSDCGRSDCMSFKGVKYAKINKRGTIYHVFGTHLNWAGSEKIRMNQLKELRAFIKSKNIDNNEKVIIGGDFNIDYYNKGNTSQKPEKTEFGLLDTVLSDSCVGSPTLPTLQGSVKYTLNYLQNNLVHEENEKDAKMRIDHVFAVGQKPTSARSQILRPRAEIGSIDSAKQYCLSDHELVLSEFNY